ncbi:MAG: hypothetical protein J0L75_11325 [Spirochaetes bacterium]|nr:hypothetical protein [Spirochaetota bacterium]
MDATIFPPFPIFQARGVGRRVALLLAALLLALALPLPAQDASTISPFPRGQAMSEAYSVFAEDAEAIFYNPALTVYGMKNNFYLNYTSWIEGTSLLSLAYRNRLARNFAVGFLSTLFVADGIETTAAPGTAPFVLNSDGIWVPITGAASFVEFNFAANASYLLPIKGMLFPLGANLKFGKYAFNGEGKTRLTLDLGTLFLIHDSFRLETRIPNSLVRGLIPSRFAFTVRNFGFEAGSVASLATDFNNPDLTVGLGFNHFSTAAFHPKDRFSYAVLSEFDLSTRQGFGWGLINRFTLGEIRPDLQFGVNYNGDTARLSAGVHTAFRIKGMDYYVSYAVRWLAGLSAAHNFAVGVNLDFDLFGPEGKNKAREARFRKALGEAQLLLLEGNYSEALFLIKGLREKYPDSQEIRELYDKVKDFDKKRDTFFQ